VETCPYQVLIRQESLEGARFTIGLLAPAEAFTYLDQQRMVLVEQRLIWRQVLL
jgi:hypothetical protein